MTYDLYPGLELQAPAGERRRREVLATTTGRCRPARHGIGRWQPCAAYRHRSAPRQVAPRAFQNLNSVQVLRLSGGGAAISTRKLDSRRLLLIENAEHTIYIENQFFASAASGGDREMGNRVAHALASRLVRAVRSGETFRCMFVLPLLPGFAHQIDRTTGQAGPLLTVMYYQYRTICKGSSSILGRLQEAIDAAVKDGTLRQGACVEDYVRFFGLRNWARLGGRFVTEGVYVHSKAMIVDDRTVVIGSANLNDRSLLGNRDSEMCVCCTDETRGFGSSMREATVCEFFGEAGAGGKLCNWVDDACGRVERLQEKHIGCKALFPY